MSRPLRAAVLTVSDTCSADASKDKSTERIVDIFATSARTWEVVHTAICADSVDDIQRIVRSWTDDSNPVNVIITSGGTGFASRDVTPEAIRPLLDKEAPGLVHAMFMKSFSVTPLAAMARLVAGVRKSTIIITVPGSPKAAVENVEAIIKLLPHACELASDSVDSRTVHANGTGPIAAAAGLTEQPRKGHAEEMNYSCGHSHGHTDAYHAADKHAHHVTHLQSNDPNKSVTKRARESPYPMVSVADALDLIFHHCPEARKTTIPIHGLQSQHQVAEYIVSEALYSREAVPAYRASIVDGYAVIASDGPGRYPVVSVSHAKADTPQTLQSGQIARITTGAPLPEGADSVVMVEYTALISSTADGGEEEIVEILGQPKRDDNIREIGSDLAHGSLVMAHGERISKTGGEIGLLASAGYSEIPVYAKPVVGVLSTGDELLDPSESQRPLRHGEIRDSNRVSLLTALAGHHYPSIDLGIVSDSTASLGDTLRSALLQCDVIISTGGVSMGELDLLKPILERDLFGTIHFGRVAMKPGKPTTFATLPVSSSSDSATTAPLKQKVPVFALPGNPASAIVTFHLFVLPLLRQLSGLGNSDAPSSSGRARSEEGRISVILKHDVTLDPRPEFHRALIRVASRGQLVAESVAGHQRSSRVSSLICHALLCLPASTPDRRQIRAGDIVQAILLDRLT